MEGVADEDNDGQGYGTERRGMEWNESRRNNGRGKMGFLKTDLMLTRGGGDGSGRWSRRSIIILCRSDDVYLLCKVVMMFSSK